VLTTLPEVSSVLSDGEQLLVTGNNEALQAVIAVLARQGVIAQHLRVEQATLDDAFVALTGNQR
jgi:ABC-2 type transport system ATP-binding protein